MDTLQAQISDLRNRIDSLYGLIEQIDERLKVLNSQQPSNRSSESYSLPNFALNSSSLADGNGEEEYQLTHKDILVDDNSSTNTASSGSENFSPDTQIRRLTAQLTAAYNRIAALEEQLLTYRIHS